MVVQSSSQNRIIGHNSVANLGSGISLTPMLFSVALTNMTIYYKVHAFTFFQGFPQYNFGLFTTPVQDIKY